LEEPWLPLVKLWLQNVADWTPSPCKKNKKKNRQRKRKNRTKEELFPHLANGEKKVVC
jgi:hypothetical protein